MTFTTVVDKQSSVEIHVLQGEREVAQGNRSLGKFELVGIPPAPRGVPQIEVVFEVDANGILNVSAIDKTTSNQQQMRITPTSGLSPEEIDRLLVEAELQAEADVKLKEAISVRLRLDSLVRNTQRTLSSYSKSLSPAEFDDAKHLLNDAETTLQSNDATELRNTLGNVERLAAHLTEVLMTMPPPQKAVEEATGV